MEKIIRRLFLSGTLLVGLAVTGLSLQTYADETTYKCDDGSTLDSDNKTCTSDGDSAGISGTTSFSIKIDKALTLSNVQGADIDKASFASVAEGTIKATVTSNSKYSISLSATEPNLKLSGDPTGAQVIQASDTVTKGGASINGTLTSTWGVKKAGADDYTAITPSPVSFFTSTGKSAATGTETILTVGVGVTPTLQAGSYSTQITVTAASV